MSLEETFSTTLEVSIGIMPPPPPPLPLILLSSYPIVFVAKGVEPIVTMTTMAKGMVKVMIIKSFLHVTTVNNMATALIIVGRCLTNMMRLLTTCNFNMQLYNYLCKLRHKVFYFHACYHTLSVYLSFHAILSYNLH